MARNSTTKFNLLQTWLYVQWIKTYLWESSSIGDPCSEDVILLYGAWINDFSDFPKLLFKVAWLLLLLFLWPSLLPLPSMTLPFEGTGCGDILPARLFSVWSILTVIVDMLLYPKFSCKTQQNRYVRDSVLQ